MDVTITCSNLDFCFVSESNPIYKRPFELVLFVVYQNFRFESDWSDWGTKNPVWENGGRVETIKIEESGTIPIDRTDENGKTYDFVHFDLVLALPGTFDDNGDLLYGNPEVRYPLIERDDYTASVTITIEAEGAINTPQTITIPFSGFYKKGADDNLKRNDTVNVSINRLPAAANLDLKNLSNTSGPGDKVKVAEIDLMLYTDDDNYGTDGVKMFFSASNDPLNGNSDGFRFVHSSVNYSTIRNGYNSLGYTISTKSYPKGKQFNHGAMDDGFHGYKLDVNGTDVVFSGNEYIDVPSSQASLQRKGSLGAGYQLDFVYPSFHKAYTFQQDYYDHVWEAGDLNVNGSNDIPKYYYSWHGDVYLQFNKREVENMFAGRYTSTVYFHVIAPDNV